MPVEDGKIFNKNKKALKCGFFIFKQPNFF